MTGLKIAESEDEKKSFEEQKAATQGLCSLIKEVLDDKVSAHTPDIGTYIDTHGHAHIDTHT